MPKNEKYRCKNCGKRFEIEVFDKEERRKLKGEGFHCIQFTALDVIALMFATDGSSDVWLH